MKGLGVSGTVSVALLVIVAACTLLAPVVASEEPLVTIGDTVVHAPVRWNPDSIDLSRRLQPPDAVHLLGTDELGRDVLARILHGGRVSLAIGFISAAIALLVGLSLGLASGWFGGWVDWLVMRLIELAVCFPFYFLALAVVAILEPSFVALLTALSLTTWTTEARLVRGEVLRLKGTAMLEAAVSAGAGDLRLLSRHLLPNAVTPALVASTFGVASAILAESALSFLGFGVPLPQASWGTMLASADDHLRTAWWLAAFPGAAIVITVAAVQVLGERIRRVIAVEAVPLRLR